MANRIEADAPELPCRRVAKVSRGITVRGLVQCDGEIMGKAEIASVWIIFMEGLILTGRQT